MHPRAPTARAEHQIASDTAWINGPVRRRDERCLHCTAPGDADDRVTAQHLDPARGELGDERLVRPGAEVGKHRHLDPCLDQFQNRPVRRVVVGDGDRPGSWAHRVTANVGERRGSEHHPGAIVVGEHQRTLRRTGCEHDTARPHLPQAFVDPRLLGGRQLHDGEHIVVVVARDGGPVEPDDVREGVELRRHFRRPFERRAPADLRRAVEERPTRLRSIVRDHHPGAAAPHGQRRLKPRRTGSCDQHFAMVEAFLVRVPARTARRDPEARHAADEPPVEIPPAGRPHERLVVEPGCEQRREPIVDRAQVEADTRPAVDAASAQAVPEQEGRRPCVGLIVVAIELHDGVGLLGSGGDDPSRAVVLEAASDQTHAVGHQGGGEGVAGMTLVVRPVEPEGEPAGAIDERPARGEPERLRTTHRRIDSIRPLAYTEAPRFIAGPTPATPRARRRRLPRFPTPAGGGGFEVAPGSRTRPRTEATRQ